MIRHFCDGCGRELNAQALAETHAAAQQFAMAHPEASQMLVELFCHICLPRADAYWMEKITVMKDTMDVARRRLENFRKQFWAQPKMKVAK